MSIALATATFDADTYWAPRGVSPESEELRELEGGYRTDRQTLASCAWRDFLVEQIADLLQECSDPGWDGYDAAPISSGSACSAVELIRGLPEGFQLPTVVPEPDGDIAFEWRTDDNCLFSLSVTGPTLVYAGRFGGPSRQYGEEPFLEAIPRNIVEILAQHFPAG